MSRSEKRFRPAGYLVLGCIVLAAELALSACGNRSGRDSSAPPLSVRTEPSDTDETPKELSASAAAGSAESREMPREIRMETEEDVSSEKNDTPETGLPEKAPEKTAGMPEKPPEGTAGITKNAEMTETQPDDTAAAAKEAERPEKAPSESKQTEPPVSAAEKKTAAAESTAAPETGAEALSETAKETAANEPSSGITEALTEKTSAGGTEAVHTESAPQEQAPAAEASETLPAETDSEKAASETERPMIYLMRDIDEITAEANRYAAALGFEPPPEYAGSASFYADSAIIAGQEEEGLGAVRDSLDWLYEGSRADGSVRWVMVAVSGHRFYEQSGREVYYLRIYYGN